MHSSVLLKFFTKEILEEIANHPKTYSVLGAAISTTIGFIPIDSAITWLKLTGEILKFIGIFSGSSVAVYGFCKTFFPKKKSKN